MDINEVKRRIESCDMERPFAFVSYSSADRDVVWQDVLELQQQGYNIWLDEANLDKTKDSWKDDAINAIKDLECRLLIFYVSKNSLTSGNCYQEVMTCEDDIVKMLHQNKRLPYIIVDAHPIADITKLHAACYAEIQEGKNGLKKSERTQMIMTMAQFMKDVFNSSNDRIRIHSKFEKGRDPKDYMRDITDSLVNNGVLSGKPVAEAASAAEPVSEKPAAKKAAIDKKAATRMKAVSAVPEAVKAAPVPAAPVSTGSAGGYPLCYCRKDGRVGVLKQTGEKEFLVLAGAEMRADNTPTCPEQYLKFRSEIISFGQAEDSGEGHYTLTVDVPVTSMSLGAGILVGRSVNGRDFWQAVETPADPLDRTIGEVRKMFEQEDFCRQVANLRKNDLPWGGRGALDYAMAAILGGCNSVKTPAQINYYCFAIADMSKKKESGSLGATWTWSSNCRKLLGESGSGKINAQTDEYFAALPEDTALRRILEGFDRNEEFFQTQKNDLVMECLKKFVALL